MPAAPRGRAIDHLVLVVRDLDAAGQFYERLGFRVGGRNCHPWGTQNRIVQFPNRTFLELITVGEGAEISAHGPRFFSFGAFVRDALARREGLAMLVLRSEDAAADARHFEAAGIGAFEPFQFERTARRADGSEARVAFTLAFASDPGTPEAGFFVCEQRTPEAFWQEDAQAHPNGALGVSAVLLVANEPPSRGPFLAAFAGVPAPEASKLGFTLDLPGGRLECLTAHAATARCGWQVEDRPSPGFIGFQVSIPDLDGMAGDLAAASIPFDRDKTSILLAPDAAFGAGLAFSPLPD